MTDTPQSPAEILARANVANIAAKLKAGKTLTGSERKALSEYQAQPDTSLDGVWAKDLTALSKAITLSRKGIYEARARFPDTAPARHPDGKQENIGAWLKFRDENLVGRDKSNNTLAELKAQMMRRDIEVRDLKIARERAEVVETEVVRAMLKTLAHKMDMLLRLTLEVESGQRFLGKNAAEICAEGRLMHDEIREVLANNIANFETEAIKETIHDGDLDDNE
jgi:hypothetical protein